MNRLKTALLATVVAVGLTGFPAAACDLTCQAFKVRDLIHRIDSAAPLSAQLMRSTYHPVARHLHPDARKIDQLLAEAPRAAHRTANGYEWAEVEMDVYEAIADVPHGWGGGTAARERARIERRIDTSRRYAIRAFQKYNQALRIILDADDKMRGLREAAQRGAPATRPTIRIIEAGTVQTPSARPDRRGPHSAPRTDTLR